MRDELLPGVSLIAGSLLLLALLSVPAFAGQHRFAVRGEELTLNDQPFKVIGLRLSNALVSEADSNELIANLDTYRDHGVNTVSVFLMGSRFGDVKGYRPDGSLDPVYTKRLARILDAADRRGMVVLVGCLYWGTSRAKEGLDGWKQADAERAVANTAAWLREGKYRNVFLDPDNEGMASRERGWDIAGMIDAAHRADPGILVAYNAAGSAPPNADLTAHFGPKVKGKPWIQSEGTPGNAPGGYWGTYSKRAGYYNYIRIGRYSDAMKQDQFRQTRQDVETHSGHMLASTWLQCGPREDVGGPFLHPGGRASGEKIDEDATAIQGDAGIRWWLEYVRQRYGPWKGPGTDQGPASARPQAAAPDTAAAARPDPPPDQAYSMRLLVWGFWANQGGALDGPGGQAEATDLIKGHDADDAGNVYWTECDEPVIRCWRADTGRVVTLAGSVRGLCDGPLQRARFGGWTYNATNLLCVSPDGGHLFVRDALGKDLWRHVDSKAGVVRSLPALHQRGKGQFLIARDRMGGLFAFRTDGGEVPDCDGYRKLKVAPCPAMISRWLPLDRYALDAARMRLYWHCRGPIMMTDLKTGEVSTLTWEEKSGRTKRPINTSGPLETTTLLCPTGMSLSGGGRYLYVGQGDGSTCWRFDLEAKAAHLFGRLDGGGFGWREGDARDKNCQMTGSTGWPAATIFIPDGRGFWATCWGLYALTPQEEGK